VPMAFVDYKLQTFMHGLKLELNRKTKRERLTRLNKRIHTHAHARTYTRTHVPLLAKIEWALSNFQDTYCPINRTNKLYTILDTGCPIKWALPGGGLFEKTGLIYPIKVAFLHPF